MTLDLMARQGSIVAFDDADPAAVDRLGGKGAGLAQMTQAGLRVPPGFVITTEACRHYLERKAMPDGLAEQIFAELEALEQRSGKSFGHGPAPMLLSVRSGAPVSMPGMMDTILNLGMNRDAAVALAEQTSDTRFMAQLVSRFHAMYAEIVLDALDEPDAVQQFVNQVTPTDPAGDTFDRLWRLCEEELDQSCSESVPADPHAQLLGAVEAVFRSWNTRRARTYRDHHGVPHDLGTAVVVQAMVFGNVSDDSGSGVVFTRNPVTGEPGLFGEYLAASQGEDVVAGIRTPAPVAQALAPAVLAELTHLAAALEKSQGDVLDIEFTVERSTLYLLQVRSAKRTPEAAVRIAADLLADGTLTLAQALKRVSLQQVRQVQRPGFDTDEVAAAHVDGRCLTTGTGACPGQVSGVLVLDPDRAMSTAAAGERPVLARAITSPADLHGMIASVGIVTATGGSTSHAAVVARSLATACVVGASEIIIDESARTMTVGGCTVREGDPISLDGATGEVFLGALNTATPAAATGALAELLDRASSAAGAAVLGRAATSPAVQDALTSGASGVLIPVEAAVAKGGRLDEFEQYLADLHDTDGASPAHARGALADLVADTMTPLLTAAGETEVVVRALDPSTDELTDLWGPGPNGATLAQRLLLPLAVPTVIQAQLDGVARAVATSGRHRSVHFSVGHISDTAEIEVLRDLARPYDGVLLVGAEATSVRGLTNLAMLHDHEASGAQTWLDLYAVQAGIFGWPATRLFALEGLDDYVSRGLLHGDPRASVDPCVSALVTAVDEAVRRQLSVQLTSEVAPAVAAALHRWGVRRFAVDNDEVRPLLLALGRAVFRD